MARIELEELAHHRALGPTLAAWHVAEWGHLYEAWDYDVAVAEFAAMTTPGAIPTTWVAFRGAGRDPLSVLGSVSLIDDDDLAGFEHLTPWLASLYVPPAARGEGVGSLLVEHVLRAAYAMGIDTLYLFTAGQKDYYLQRGWRSISHATTQDHDAAVMARRTSPRAARRSTVSTWVTDPDTAGAYSYLRVGGHPAARDVLAQSVHRGLWLTGEATSREFPGTLHGAWFSGERAAQQVIATRQDRQTSAPVVVVGAGLAGIAAARVFQESAHDVIVVESKAWPGGRARTDTSVGFPVQLGGAWLHGDAGHPLIEFGVSGTATNWDKAATFVVGSGQLDTRAHRILQRDLESQLEQQAKKLAAAGTDVAYGDAALAMLSEFELLPKDEAVLATWISGTVENLYAAPLNDLSLRHGAEPYELPGANLLISTPLQPILQELTTSLDVRYLWPVQSITALPNGEWRVEGPAGATLHATDVIVTIPLGALQGGRVRFDPPFPPEVTDALAQLAAGPVAKAFFTFDEAFWLPNRTFWIVAEPRAVFACWFDVSELAGRPMLCAFAVGADAAAVERMTEDERCRLADVLLASAMVGQ